MCLKGFQIKKQIFRCHLSVIPDTETVILLYINLGKEQNDKLILSVHFPKNFKTSNFKFFWLPVLMVAVIDGEGQDGLPHWVHGREYMDCTY